jgi:hypothetical protein
MANIYGTLSDHNDKGLASELIVLSYTFDGVNELYPIGSVLTDENGQYSLQWFNPASGTILLMQNGLETRHLTAFQTL